MLRPPAARDGEAYIAFYASERSAFSGGPMPRQCAWKAWCAEFGHWEMRGYGMWSVTTKDDDSALGVVGCWYPDGHPEPEIAFLMWEGGEGKGYAFEAAMAARAWAYETLNWTTAVSSIVPGNDRSIALAKRMGATLDMNADKEFDDDLVYRHPSPDELKGVAA